MKHLELKPIFMEQLPENKDMESGIHYISKKYGVSKHLCVCGCGITSVLPFSQIINGRDIGWKFTFENDLVTTHPSIGNFSGEIPYHAHYYIVQNKIKWC